MRKAEATAWLDFGMAWHGMAWFDMAWLPSTRPDGLSGFSMDTHYRAIYLWLERGKGERERERTGIGR